MGADTLHRPPLFQHHLSARSVAALDLLRAFSALFGFTPAADRPGKCWDQAVECALANRHRTPATGKLNFLSLDWGGDMRFRSIRAAAALVVVAMSKLGLPVAAAVLTAAFSH